MRHIRKPDPTVEEITEEARRIREGWSEADHRSRWLSARTIGRYDVRDLSVFEFPRYYGEAG